MKRLLKKRNNDLVLINRIVIVVRGLWKLLKHTKHHF